MSGGRFLVLVLLVCGVLWWQQPPWLLRAEMKLGLRSAPPQTDQPLLFTAPGCGKGCTELADLLRERVVPFEEIEVSNDDAHAQYRSLGGTGLVPYLVIDGVGQAGFQQMSAVSFLAEHYGEMVLMPAERTAMAKNFDANGRPRVVMFSTVACGYCRAAREYFTSRGIPWVERDVERDPASAADFRLLAGHGTPLIYVGYRRVDGFDQKRLAKALEIL